MVALETFLQVLLQFSSQNLAFGSVSSLTGNGTPFQYSCLGNSMDRGASWPTVHEVMKEANTI